MNRAKFESNAEDRLAEIARELTAVATVELRKLATRFPTRRFFYRESMGTADIYVEVFSSSWVNKGARHNLFNTDTRVVSTRDMGAWDQNACYGDLFEDFEGLLGWINDMSDTYRVTCDDIDIPATENRRTS